MSPHGSTAAPRACGECTRCCVDLRIPSMDKRAGFPCGHLRHGPQFAERHCGRYADRPAECAGFHCLWRLLDAETLPAAYRPDICGMILSPRMATELGLPPRGTGEWLVIVAEPVHDRTGKPRAICTSPAAMEAIRRCRVAGLAVLIDEHTVTGCKAWIEEPVRPPSTHVIARLNATAGVLGGDRFCRDAGDAGDWSVAGKGKR